MDVNEKPEILERGMYQATGEFAVERPVIEQENDVESPFTDDSLVGIPQHLLDLIHEVQSVDPEVPEVEQVASDVSVDVEKSAEENPNSRFRVLDTALLPPGVCALCGSSGGDGRQFVDFGKTMNWYGTIYFCTFCVAEAAKLLGFIGSRPLEILTETYLSLKDKYEAHKLVCGEQLNAAMVLLRNCTCSNSGIGDPVVEIPEADIVEPEPDVVNDEPAIESEPDVDEPVVEQGPDDISGSPVNDESILDVKPPTRRVRKSS